MPAWHREFEQWAPEHNLVVYVGDVTSRQKVREEELGGGGRGRGRGERGGVRECVLAS